MRSQSSRVIAPGMMGSAVAARLVENGIEVRTALSAAAARRRSHAPKRPAWSAHPMRRSPPQTSSCRSCRQVMRWDWRNAWPLPCAPLRRNQYTLIVTRLRSGDGVAEIARVVQETGATFVDGGIIRGPPQPGSKATKIYLSGEAAPRGAEQADYCLHMPIHPGPIGAASATSKMSYAGITKGFTALWCGHDAGGITRRHGRGSEGGAFGQPACSVRIG